VSGLQTATAAAATATDDYVSDLIPIRWRDSSSLDDSPRTYVFGSGDASTVVTASSASEPTCEPDEHVSQAVWDQLGERLHVVGRLLDACKDQPRSVATTGFLEILRVAHAQADEAFSVGSRAEGWRALNDQYGSAISYVVSQADTFNEWCLYAWAATPGAALPVPGRFVEKGAPDTFVVLEAPAEALAAMEEEDRKIELRQEAEYRRHRAARRRVRE